jgi:hypothetical protein
MIVTVVAVLCRLVVPTATLAPDRDCTAEEVRVEEIVTSSALDDTVTFQGCMMGQAAVVDWKGKSPLYHSSKWRVARVKCVPSSLRIAGAGVAMPSNAEKQAEKERNFTAEMLRAALHYDPLTGIFRHIKAKRGIRAGAIAGRRVSGKGYWQICINYQYFYAHRLAWLYVTGEWPPHESTTTT